jgi:transcription elongation factor GreB
MSRGFVNEDRQEEAPFIPPRAPLPAGVPNYVRAVGLRKLKNEKENLIQEREQLAAENEVERRRLLAEINGKLELLEQRLQSAEIVPSPKGDERNSIRFGARVTARKQEGGEKLTFTIVGVDEGNIKEGLFSFTAPLVKAFTGKRVGEQVGFKDTMYTVEEIYYSHD